MSAESKILLCSNGATSGASAEGQRRRASRSNPAASCSPAALPFPRVSTDVFRSLGRIRASRRARPSDSAAPNHPTPARPSCAPPANRTNHPNFWKERGEEGGRPSALAPLNANSKKARESQATPPDLSERGVLLRHESLRAERKPHELSASSVY